jgi:hypothetical protein
MIKTWLRINKKRVYGCKLLVQLALCAYESKVDESIEMLEKAVKSYAK